MGKFGKELIESMRQAAQHAEGGKARGMPSRASPKPSRKPCNTDEWNAAHGADAQFRGAG